MSANQNGKTKCKQRRKNMKIALTGSSSTGKTTLINYLAKNVTFQSLIKTHVTADARKLLNEMGCQNTDLMSSDDLRKFQIAYVNHKWSLEEFADSYITERSFIDCAAFWLQRDNLTCKDDRHLWLVNLCHEYSKRYDLHFYLPFGLIKFEADGYRSTNLELHKRVDQQILQFLKKWKIKYYTLSMASLEERASVVLKAIRFENDSC